MKKLTDDVRRFIVHCLAAFDTPTKVAESVKSEFGLDVTRQAVASHDPTKKTGQQLAQRWKDEFHEARRKFLEELDEIPIANKAYRLRQLGDLYGNAGKNAVLKMQLLKQAAEEVGGVYEAKRADCTKTTEQPHQQQSDYKVLRPDERIPENPVT